MKKHEAEQLVINTFTYKFSEEQFTNFIRNLLPDLEAPSTRIVPNTQLPQGFREHVYNYTRVGTYHDPKGDVLDVVIVKLKNQSSLDRARTRQRNLMAHYLSRRTKDAVLVAYIADDPSDWRFSYVKLAFQTEITDQGKVKVNQEYTPARRYSFLVGKHEPNHTAQKQLGDLLMLGVRPMLGQIETAFNIESVTKEFFEDYKKLFLMIKENLDRIVETKPQVQAEFDRCEIDTANFAKKLLGQIVFLYFLQKKGWLGVAEEKAWGTGDKKFLSNLFEKNKDENFFDDILEPFFYEALAMERKGDYYPRLQCKVPFLNGGLFEPLNGYDWENTSIGLDNKDFEEIFRVFNSYNFTVREDEPLEKEVAVDPEMLGKVFENLLEVKDRKSKGAFYTPREIVHYMCQESLINYLDAALNQKEKNLAKEDGIQSDLFGNKPDHQMVIKEKVYQELIPLADIETFIREGEISIERDQAREEGKLGDDDYGLPESIRKFAEQIDFALADVKICDPAIGSGAFPVGMMTEIVRARSVLSPYLPSQLKRDPYTFKWHCIENNLYGVDIDASAVEIAKLRLWLSLVVDEESYDHIRPLPNLDYRIVYGNSLQSITKDLFNYTLYPELEKKKLQYFGTTSQKNKGVLRQEIGNLIDQLTSGRQDFDFEVYFSEVFDKKEGFDVVIGNPPYYQLSKDKNVQENFKIYLREKFHTSGGRLNLFIFFTHLGINILKTNGILAVIIPNTILSQEYYKDTRKKIITETQIKSIVTYEDLKFEKAVVENISLIVSKNKTQDYNVKIINNNDLGFEIKRKIPSKNFSKEPYYRFSINSRLFVEELFHNSTPLKKICNINQAIALKGDKSLSVKYEEKDGYYKLLDGKNINKFGINWTGEFLDYDISKIHSCKTKDIFLTNEKLLFRRVSTSLIFAYDDQQYFALNTIVVVTMKNNLKNETISLKFLLALLNSRLLNFIYLSKFKSTKTVFSEIQARSVGELPIILPQDQNPFIAYTNKIIEKKSKSFTSDTSILESQIDQLVYELYGLTEEKIAIVEESMGM